VALNNASNAALLLMSLDPSTAAELLKAARPEAITEIAAELVHIEASGPGDQAAVAGSVREFCGLLKTRTGKRESFVREMLSGAVGRQRCEELFGKAISLLETRDPFMSIRSTNVVHLAQALEGQHPQVAAIVLMEIPPDRSAQLIALLEEAVRNEAIRRMTSGETVLPEAKARIAALVRSRVREVTATPDDVRPKSKSAAAAQDDRRLRQVAVLLRSLKKELRDSLIAAVGQKSTEVAEAVQDLMIQWEDMPIIPDRPLQEVLRSVDGQKLALALVKASGPTGRKIRGNISERARAMIDEETSLMRKPKSEDIEEAREGILQGLRELNKAGAMEFSQE